MKNLLKPELNYYNAHKEYYQKRLSKRPDLIPLLSHEQEDELKKAYQEYETLFDGNHLNQLKQYSFLKPTEKEAYLNLFQSSLTYFRKLNQNSKYITETKVGDCPFCEHGKPSTLDHIVPKSAEDGFPEFCDNALNLIPMCSNCNSHKGKIFKNKAGELELVNLYRDTLPDVQYLFANIFIVESDNLTIKFFVDKNTIADSDLARRIDNTYDYLGIYDYYIELSENRIDSLKNQIQDFKSSYTKDQIKEYLKIYCTEKNFWEHVLIRAVVQNNAVFDLLYN